MQVISPLMKTTYFCVSTPILKKFVLFVYNSFKRFSTGFIELKTFE